MNKDDWEPCPRCGSKRVTPYGKRILVCIIIFWRRLFVLARTVNMARYDYCASYDFWKPFSLLYKKNV